MESFIRLEREVPYYYLVGFSEVWNIFGEVLDIFDFLWFDIKLVNCFNGGVAWLRREREGGRLGVFILFN